jgi:small subunit ribosomal protein S19
MSRSAKKGPYVDEKLFRKVSKLNENRAKQAIKTWARACTIIPEFVGHTFEVHNGNKFLKVFVQEDMVGHKLGEFAPTRIFKGHSGKKAAAAAAAAAATAAGGGGAAPPPAPAA